MTIKVLKELSENDFIFKTTKYDFIQTSSLKLIVSKSNPYYETINALNKEISKYRQNILKAKDLRECKKRFIKHCEIFLEISDDIINKPIFELNKDRCLLVYEAITEYINENTITDTPDETFENCVVSYRDRYKLSQNTEELYKNNEFLEFSSKDLSSQNLPFSLQKDYEKTFNYAQDIIAKYNLACIYIENKSETSIENIIPQLMAIDLTFENLAKTIGIKKEYLSFNGKLSLNLTETDFFGTFDPSGINIQIPLKTTEEDSSSLGSTVLHEWIHAVDFNVMDEITQLKFIKKREYKPDNNYSSGFAAEYENLFYCHPEDFNRLYPYLIIRDLIEFLLTGNKDSNRLSRGKKILEKFYINAFNKDWFINKSPKEKEILLSEMAYLNLRSTVSKKHIRQADKITHITEFLINNGITMTNDETTMIETFLNSIKKEAIKKEIEESETPFNKSGSLYLENTKKEDRKTMETIIKDNEHKEDITISQRELKIDIKTVPYVQKNFFSEHEEYYYLQQPSEMLSRYFEKNVYSMFTTMQSIRSKTFRSFPYLRDCDFEAKKDAILVSFFGFECLSPKHGIKEKLHKLVALNNSNQSLSIQECNQALKQSLNPTQDILKLSKAYRKAINQS